MASGDRLLDADGNVNLDDDGNVMLSDDAGDLCCCSTLYMQARRCEDDETIDLWTVYNVLQDGIFQLGDDGGDYQCYYWDFFTTSTTPGTIAGPVLYTGETDCLVPPDCNPPPNCCTGSPRGVPPPKWRLTLSDVNFHTECIECESLPHSRTGSAATLDVTVDLILNNPAMGVLNNCYWTQCVVDPNDPEAGCCWAAKIVSPVTITTRTHSEFGELGDAGWCLRTCEVLATLYLYWDGTDLRVDIGDLITQVSAYDPVTGTACEEFAAEMVCYTVFRGFTVRDGYDFNVKCGEVSPVVLSNDPALVHELPHHQFCHRYVNAWGGTAVLVPIWN